MDAKALEHARHVLSMAVEVPDAGREIAMINRVLARDEPNAAVAREVENWAVEQRALLASVDSVAVNRRCQRILAALVLASNQGAPHRVRRRDLAKIETVPAVLSGLESDFVVCLDEELQRLERSGSVIADRVDEGVGAVLALSRSGVQDRATRDQGNPDSDDLVATTEGEPDDTTTVARELVPGVDLVGLIFWLILGGGPLAAAGAAKNDEDDAGDDDE